jgi:hypothetical protein
MATSMEHPNTDLMKLTANKLIILEGSSNYREWAEAMINHLRACGLGSLVLGTEPRPTQDRQAVVWEGRDSAARSTIQTQLKLDTEPFTVFNQAQKAGQKAAALWQLLQLRFGASSSVSTASRSTGQSTNPSINQSVVTAHDRAIATIAGSLELVNQGTDFALFAKGWRNLQDIAFDDTLSTLITGRAMDELMLADLRGEFEFMESGKTTPPTRNDHPHEQEFLVSLSPFVLVFVVVIVGTNGIVAVVGVSLEFCDMCRKKKQLEQAGKQQYLEQTRMPTSAQDNNSAEAFNRLVHDRVVSEGWTEVDDTSLAEYLVLMLANDKTQTQVAAELPELIEGVQGTDEFASWLFQQISPELSRQLRPCRFAAELFEQAREEEQPEQAREEEQPEQACKEQPCGHARIAEQAWKEERLKQAEPVQVEDGSRGNHFFWISGAMADHYGID